MTKVLQIVPSLNSINGGVERGALDVAKELIEQGFDSEIISSGGMMAEKYKYKGVNHNEIEINKKGFINFLMVRRKFEKMLNKKRFEDYDKETIDMFLESIKDFSDRELFPVFKEMDEKPAYYEDGKIHVHDKVKTLMHQGGEMGIISASFDYKDGGMFSFMKVDVMIAVNDVTQYTNYVLPSSSSSSVA